MYAQQFLRVFIGLVLMTSGVAFADDAASRAIVEKAIERLGDADRLAKFHAMTSKLKGTIQLNGARISFTGEINLQGGTQQRISVSLLIDSQAITFASIVNQSGGWQKINDNTIDMSPDQLADAKESAYTAWVTTLLPLRDKAFKLAPFGEVEIDGRKVVGVNVTREGHRSLNLFFDKETYRLVRSDATVRDEMTFKDVSEETTYGDYKAFEGIQHPTKLKIKRDGLSYAELEVEDFKASEKIDDSTFAKP